MVKASRMLGKRMPVFEPALRRDGRGSVAGRRGWRALLLLLLAPRLPDLGFLFFL